MTDRRGLFEHADGTIPRIECGYCLDDVARALVVTCRQRPSTALHLGLVRRYLGFVISAQAADGRFHNRLSARGLWEDEPHTGDWWGRGLWGLGTAAVRATEPTVRRRAMLHFGLSASLRSADPRAMAFAMLGAAEILAEQPGDPACLELASDVVTAIGRPAPSASWRWPQPRLSYANAALAEAMIAAGSALGDATALDDGLAMLRWLVDHETHDGRFSVVGVGGGGPADARPAFDQQPIEVAALADACDRAWLLTADPYWTAGLDRAIAWFLGHNDSGTPLYDGASGGGRDAITVAGCNTNQGAESTLALISTLQHAHPAPDRRHAGERTTIYIGSSAHVPPSASLVGPSP
jgi:hypothetical protein